jgi:hypothetical protein
VPDQVVEDPGVALHIGKYLFCLCTDEDCENLGEVPAEDRVELFFGLQKGQVSLKNLVLIGFNGYPYFWNSFWLSRLVYVIIIKIQKVFCFMGRWRCNLRYNRLLYFLLGLNFNFICLNWLLLFL